MLSKNKIAFYKTKTITNLINKLMIKIALKTYCTFAHNKNQHEKNSKGSDSYPHCAVYFIKHCYSFSCL